MEINILNIINNWDKWETLMSIDPQIKIDNELYELVGISKPTNTISIQINGEILTKDIKGNEQVIIKDKQTSDLQ